MKLEQPAAGVRALAAGLNPRRGEPMSQVYCNRTTRTRFGLAHEEWALALADVARLNAGGYDEPREQSDARTDQVLDRMLAATWGLVRAPATSAVELTAKIEALQVLLNEREKFGRLVIAIGPFWARSWPI
jgi:hypothetical protein